MAIELGGTQLDDPLGGSSLLSLLPKTLGGGLSHSQIDDSEARELESIKSLFKSMVEKGSTQVMQQAQTIAKSYTNNHSIYSEDGSYAANCQDRPAERRPALGRKRAKFSLKPVPSHSLPNIDMSLSIGHIDDPEEYFSAFEQLENAERELKKLRGDVTTDPVQHHQCTTARKRRPGLLGKTANYKHHSSAYADMSENLVESQEELVDRRTLISSNTSLDTESCNLLHPGPAEKPGTSHTNDANSELQDAIESEGSVVEKEKKVSNLLEKLLSSFKDFDGDEGKTFLRESLQIKSIDTGKVQLPELGNAQLSQHSPSKHIAELKSSQTSRYLTKSPLAAISALQRRVSLKDPLKDLYSAFPNDEAPCSEDSSLSKSTGKVSLSPVDVGNHDNSNFLFDGASSPVVEKGTRLGLEDDICAPVGESDRSIDNDIITKEKSRKHPHPLLEINENPDSNGVINDKSSIFVGCDGTQEANTHALRTQSCIDQQDAGIEGLTLSCGNQPRAHEILDHASQLLGGNTNCDPNASDKDKDVSGGFDGGLQVEVDNMHQDLSITNELVAAANQTSTQSLASPPSRNMGGNCSSPGTNFENGFSGLDDMSHPKFQGDAMVHEKVTDAVGTSKDTSCRPEATVLTDQHLEIIHFLPEENIEEHQTASGPPPNKGGKQKAPSHTRNKKKSNSGRQILAGSPPNEGRKQKAPPRTQNKKKSSSGRQSISGAGMIWEDGRRKSLRHRFRPLEHWRGERLLYGRIHPSLATVIGVKYVSPGKDTVKVESFVSEEYADLVAQVAQ